MPITHYTTSIANGSTSTGSIAISPAVVKANTFISFTIRGGNGNPSDSRVVPVFTGSAIEFVRGTTNGVLDISYTLVESTLFAVQHYSGALAATSSLAITLDTSINTAESWPILYSAGNDDAFSFDEVLRVALTSTVATITCQNTSSVGYYLQVVSSTIFSVQVGTYSFNTTGNSRNVTLSTAVDISKSFVIISHTSNSSLSTRLGEKFERAYLSNTTTVTIERMAATASHSGTFYVVSLPSSCIVTTSGLITFGGTTSPSSPTGAFNAPTAWDRTWVFPSGSPHFCLSSDTSGADDASRIQATVTPTDDGVGGTNITLLRTSTSGNAATYVVAVFIPTSLEGGGTTLNLFAYSIGRSRTQSLIIASLALQARSIGASRDTTQSAVTVTLQAITRPTSRDTTQSSASLALQGTSRALSQDTAAGLLSVALQGLSRAIATAQTTTSQASTLQASSRSSALDFATFADLVQVTLALLAYSGGRSRDFSNIAQFNTLQARSLARTSERSVIVKASGLQAVSRGIARDYSQLLKASALQGIARSVARDYSASSKAIALQAISRAASRDHSTAALIRALLAYSVGSSRSRAAASQSASLAAFSRATSSDAVLLGAIAQLSAISRAAGLDLASLTSIREMSGYSRGFSSDRAIAELVARQPIDLLTVVIELSVKPDWVVEIATMPDEFSRLEVRAIANDIELGE
jgi:hypothetical protein